MPAGIQRLRGDPGLTTKARAVLAALQFLSGNFSEAYNQQKKSLLEARSQDDAGLSRYAARLVQYGASAGLLTGNPTAPTGQCLEVVSVLTGSKEPRFLEVAYFTLEEQAAGVAPAPRTILSIENSADCSAKPMRIEIAPEDWRRTQELFPLKPTARRATTARSSSAFMAATPEQASRIRH